ncbi:MAG: hypothetical protein JW774_03320 [Candidatus Aureabacteria bacterium]|nr:hypothetical protein [Candidatus Auribacterota bacterium]
MRPFAAVVCILLSLNTGFSNQTVSSSTQPTHVIFHVQDLYGKQIEPPSTPVRLRLLLFFSKKHASRFEKFKKEIYDQIYDNPKIQILLVLQKTGINPMMRKKLKRELLKEFENENLLRKEQLKKLFPAMEDEPPGLQLIPDWDGSFSISLKINPALKKPLALFVDKDGKGLISFSSDQIQECLKWLKNKGDIQ